MPRRERFAEAESALKTAQNRATIEAVLHFREEFLRDRAEDRERFDRLDNAILKLSSDVVVLKTDVAVLKTDMQSVKAALARVESKVDGKADAAALRALEIRVSAMESSSPSA
jgi:predicted  nucleic acid-binding Zn-ribbon protein